MDKIPLVIGYTIEKAMQLIGAKHKVIINSTSTPYKDKTEERQGNIPIVVRQKEENDEIMLTTSLFK